MSRLHRFHSFAAVAVLSAALAACQATPPLMRTEPADQAAAAAHGPMATVQVDLSKLKGFGPQRTLKDSSFQSSEIEHVILTAQGPGLALATSGAAPFTSNANGTPPVVSISIPVVKNVVITLKGLNHDGQVVASLRTLVSLSAATTVPVTINANTDAAARALEAVLGQTDGSAIAALSTTDLTAQLLAYVTQITGYNENTNTYTGVAPTYFAAGKLAGLLHDGGTTVLTSTPPDLNWDVAQEVDVTVNIPGATDASGTVVDVLAPGVTQQTIADGDHVAAFFTVPTGTWTVRASFGGKTAYGTVTVTDASDATFAVTLNMPTGTESYISVTPVSEPSPNGTVSGDVGSVVTLAGGAPVNVSSALSFAAGNGVPLVANTSSPTQVACDAHGNSYLLAYNQVLKVPTSGGRFARMAWNYQYDATSPLTGGLKSVTVNADGSLLYVLDSNGNVVKVPGQGSMTKLTQIADATQLCLTPANVLLVCRSHSIESVDLVTGNTAVVVNGLANPAGLAVRPNGDLAFDDRDNGIFTYLHTQNDHVATRYAGSETGDVDGTLASGSFASIGAMTADTSGTLYAADTGNRRIRAISASDVSTFAGFGVGQTPDGTPRALMAFNTVTGVAFDALNNRLVLADAGNHRLLGLPIDGKGKGASTLLNFGDPDSNEGDAATSRLSGLNSVAAGTGGIFPLSTSDNDLWRIPVGDSGVTAQRYAGTGQLVSGTDLSGADPTTFKLGRTIVQAVAGQNGKVFVLDLFGGIVAIDTNDGQATAITPTGLSAPAKAIAVNAAGNLYALSGSNIYQVDQENGGTTLRTAAGPGATRFVVLGSGPNDQYYDTDGTTLYAGQTAVTDFTFNAAQDLAVDQSSGTLYVAEGQTISTVQLQPGSQSIFLPTGKSPLTGSAGATDDADGPLNAARFKSAIEGLSFVDMGDGLSYLYVVEPDRVRRIKFLIAS